MTCQSNVGISGRGVLWIALYSFLLCMPATCPLVFKHLKPRTSASTNSPRHLHVDDSFMDSEVSAFPAVPEMRDHGSADTSGVIGQETDLRIAKDLISAAMENTAVLFTS